MKLLRITIELEDDDGNTLQLTDGSDVTTVERVLTYLLSNTTKRFDGMRFDDLVYVGRRIVRAAEAIVRVENERKRRAEIEDSLRVDGQFVTRRVPVEGSVLLDTEPDEDDDIDGCPI